jgi:hypothetical protein
MLLLADGQQGPDAEHVSERELEAIANLVATRAGR